MADSGEFTARITKCNNVYQGTTSKGDPYTRYEVELTNASGEVIAGKFNSFELLPVGSVVALKWKTFRSQQYGDSYTLQLKNKADKPAAAPPPSSGPPPGAPTGPPGASASAAPAQLEHELKLLSERLARVETYLANKPWANAPVPQPVAAPPQQQFAPPASEFRPATSTDDDIPF